MAEHRVELVKRLDLGLESLRGYIDVIRQGFDLLIGMRQEFVQRRVEKPDRDQQVTRKALEAYEDDVLVRSRVWETAVPRRLF